MIKIQKYKSIYDKSKGETLSFESFVEEVRKYKMEADIAFMKPISKKDYQKAKAALPCVSLPFFYGKKRTGSFTLRATGLVYFDIDDCEFDVDTLDKSLIYSYWKTISGDGYAIVVRTEGARSSSKEDYRAQIEHLAHKLGIFPYYDRGAACRNQAVNIPNDPNIFYNPSSKVFDITGISNTDISDKAVIKKKAVKKKSIKRKGRKMKVCFKVTQFNLKKKPRENGERSIFFDNRHHFDIGDSAYEKFEGSKLVEVNMYGYKEGMRNTIVSCALTNAVWLNYNLEVKDVAKVIYKIMDSSPEKNLPKEEFNSIVCKVAELKERCELQPIPSTKKYFIVTQGEITGYQGNGLSKIADSIERFKAVIRVWPKAERLNVAKLCKVVGLSRKTYYKHKDEITKQINMENTMVEKVDNNVVAYVTTAEDVFIIRAFELGNTLDELRSGKVNGVIEFAEEYEKFYLKKIPDLHNLDYISKNL